MSEITRDDWLDCLQQMRVGIAKMSDNDPWKATQQAHLKTLETVEKVWSDIYDRDTNRAGQIAEEVVRILEHHLCRGVSS
jgi:hypothetical protein